jgi:hypothetical protein
VGWVAVDGLERRPVGGQDRATGPSGHAAVSAA